MARPKRRSPGSVSEVKHNLRQNSDLRWVQSLLAIAIAGCATSSSSRDLATREAALRAATDAATKSRAVAERRTGSVGRPRLVDADRATPHSAPPDSTAGNQETLLHSPKVAAIELASYQEDPSSEPAGSAPKGRSTLSERLKIPEVLPGAEAPPLSLPPSDPERPQQKGLAIDALFPGLPHLASDIRTEGAPDMTRLSLADLEQIALNNNPLITQAAADIEAAMGGAVQAGAYPNPTVGYEADTVGSAGTRNYQGMFFIQDVITAGKLDLARSIANVDLMNKQLALRKARAELLAKVRTGYYAVLVARESLKYNEALVTFTNEVYRVQVEQLKGGQAAAYEPMQLRALAVQSRGAFQQAKIRYVSAWKQLAASLGDPTMPAAILEGDADHSSPPIDYETALQSMLSTHTDVLTARNLEFQARLNVRLQEVTPVPDVKIYSAIQRDFTTPPLGRTVYNVQIGVPVPVFNQNRGGIQKARGELVRASEQLNTSRNELSAQLADAFERYENNRILLQYYHDQILPDQARVYRGVYERHQQVSEQVGFGDIIVAQQNLLTSITNYVNAMNGQWNAYADLTGLLQLEDVHQLPFAEPAQLPAEPSMPTDVQENP